jgi:transcriptional regulator with XRE-family HTH domain/quercetin dioxygenase-like cupin family protein
MCAPHSRQEDLVVVSLPPIGARLRAERRRRGVSVRGLAREIGVSASLISQIETQKSSPSVSTLYAMTTALGVAIEDLFGDPPADAADVPEVDDEDAVPALVGTGGIAAGTGPVPPAAAFAAALAAAGGARLGTPLDAGPDGADADDAAGADRTVPDTRLGPVVPPEAREVLTLDSGVTWELLGRIPHKHVDFLLITYQPGGTSSSSGLLMRHSGTEFGFVISGELTLTLGFRTHRLRAGDAVSFDSSTPHSYRNESDEPAVGVWFVLERSA